MKKRCILFSVGILIFTLGIYSRYYIKGYDSIGIKDQEVISVIDIGRDSATVNLETLCENSPNVLYLHLRGEIPPIDKALEIVNLSGNSGNIRIEINERRQFILYLDESAEDPNLKGYELTAPLSGKTTEIDTRLILDAITRNGIESIYATTDTPKESVDRRVQVIAPVKVKSCIKDVRIGDRKEYLQNLTVSIGIAELNKPSDTKLILLTRSALLVLSVWFVFIASKPMKKSQKR